MKENIFDISKIKDSDYAKECIEKFSHHQNKTILEKEAKELNIIGLCYRTLENFDEAIKYFNKAINIDRNYKAPCFNLGAAGRVDFSR